MDQPTYKILNTQKDANGRVLLLCFKFMYLGRYIENSEKSYRNYALSQAASFSSTLHSPHQNLTILLDGALSII